MIDRNVPQERPLVCLVDSREDGHHPMYAAVYAEVLRELGCDVWLAAPARMIATMPPAEGTTDANGSFTVIPWEPVDRAAGDGIGFGQNVARLWNELGRVIDQAALTAGRYPDLVLHLYLDDFVAETLPRRAVESRIRCPFVGLWFKPPPRLPRTWREVAKRAILIGRRYPLLRSPLCCSILLLDASDSQHLSRLCHSEIFEVPEVSVSVQPVAEPDVVADIRGRAAGRSIFSVVGSLEGRKGLREFLGAAEAAPADEWFFVMAGRLVRESLDIETARHIEKLTTGPHPRVLLIDCWLDEEVLNAIVACSDMVHVYYNNWPYSTNMLCKTAGCCVPVIGSTTGYIGRMIRDHDLGFTATSGEAFAARFEPGFAAEVAAFRNSQRFRNGCNRYRAANNPAALAAVLANVLTHCLLSSAHRTSGNMTDAR